MGQLLKRSFSLFFENSGEFFLLFTKLCQMPNVSHICEKIISRHLQRTIFVEEICFRISFCITFIFVKIEMLLSQLLDNLDSCFTKQNIGFLLAFRSLLKIANAETFVKYSSICMTHLHTGASVQQQD